MGQNTTRLFFIRRKRKNGRFTRSVLHVIFHVFIFVNRFNDVSIHADGMFFSVLEIARIVAL